MNLKKLLIVAFLLTHILAFGQSSTEQPYIEVTGNSEKEVIPDEIYIEITIKEKHDNKNKVTIEEQEEKLKNIVKSIGIDLANLYLSDVNASYVKIRWQKKDMQTKKDYTLKVSDAKTVGKVFNELEKIEITDAFISRVSHTKLDSLRKDVKIMAIKAAKEKADYLLAAIGEKTGKPLYIRENPQTVVMSGGYANSNFDDNKNEIQFQKIKLTSSIYVKFTID